MKLYDGGRAPNPRRVRIYLAEKGIRVATEPVDLSAMQHRDASFTAINPLQRCPRWCSTTAPSITESDGDLPLFRSPAQDPPMFGTSGLEQALVEMWNAADRAQPAVRGDAGVSSSASRDGGDGGSAGRRHGARPTRRAPPPSCRSLTVSLASIRFVAGAALFGRRHYRPRRDRIHEAGAACRAARHRNVRALARGGRGTAERQGMTEAPAALRAGRGNGRADLAPRLSGQAAPL